MHTKTETGTSCYMFTISADSWVEVYWWVMHTNLKPDLLLEKVYYKCLVIFNKKGLLVGCILWKKNFVKRKLWHTAYLHCSWGNVLNPLPSYIKMLLPTKSIHECIHEYFHEAFVFVYNLTVFQCICACICICRNFKYS